MSAQIVDENKFAPSVNEDKNESNYLTINDVRITPAHMVFDNAYEGKRYVEKLVIQNIGTRIAFVRLSEPSSGTIKYKAFTQGMYLSSGMKIVRTVKYTYSVILGTKAAYANIWVNDEEIDFHFTVNLSGSILSVVPQVIDFGRMDAVNHAASRTFSITNTGCKGTHFAIDLGRNPLELIVEPMKGVIPAKTSVTVTIEIVGSIEGEVMEEMWVKTDPPLRIVVMGTFISPKLLVRKFYSSLDFTLLDFSVAYYGSRRTRPLLINNFSSSHSMFCVMAEIKGTTMTLDAAKKIDEDYRNFIIEPIDGRMKAEGGAIIQITFAPVKSSAKNYSACFLKIIRMDCRDVLEEDDICEEFHRKKEASFGDNESYNYSLSNKERDMSSITSLISRVSDEDDVPEAHFNFESSIGVCLHGQKENARISLRPTMFDLRDLTLDKIYQRELLIVNKSKILPIRVQYKKMVSIDVIPPRIDLEPGERREVLVTIRTLTLERIEKEIIFELFAKDLPKDKIIYRKVGSNSLPIYFETTKVVKKPKLDRCTKCEDISIKLAPEFPYKLSESDLEKRTRNNEYYFEFLRSLHRLPEKPIEVDKCPVKCQRLLPRIFKAPAGFPYIPLSPRLLHNIKITPKSIRLRKVAAYTTITEYFEIENLNSFPFYVFLKSSKPCLTFDNNARQVVASQQKKKIYFSFSTCNIGRYYINISVLINWSTLYEVTAVAHVVPKTLHLETKTIQFKESDGQYKFFKIMNVLNTYTSFDWEVPPGCFKIYPVEGGIKAESSLLCIVTYSPDPSESDTADCVLTSESGQKNILTVSCDKRNHLFVFDNYDIDLGLVPLNVPFRKKLTLKNLKNFDIVFSVPGGIPIPGVTIQPQEGKLDGYDSQVFIITVHLKAIIEFSTDIVFCIDEEEISIPIRGKVDYPQIIIKPDTLNFRKISPYSFDTLAFKVTNMSENESCVTFPVEDCPEFSVSESQDDVYSHKEMVKLQPGQSKILFFNFHPNYISTCNLYLPYCINNILGPLQINNSTNTSPMFYLRENALIYEENPKVRVIKISKTLPLVRVSCGATEKTLEFNSLNINLWFFGQNHYNNLTKTDFEITNCSTKTVELCIRIDDLKPPLSLTPTDECIAEYYPVSYKITIEPGEKAVLEAEFSPFDIGRYEVKLPIFLRGYYDNKIFNYLTLRGVYTTPSIVPSVKVCNFEPVPIRLTGHLELTLKMENHFENCQVYADCDILELMTGFHGSSKEIKVSLTYDARRTQCLDTILTIRCTCQSFCTIAVTGVTEKCILTTHAFFSWLKQKVFTHDPKKSIANSALLHSRRKSLVANKNLTSFPLFPEDDDDSWYGNYMRRVQKTLENWLYSQGFYMKGYYRIPEGFSDYCKVKDPPVKMRFGGYKKPKLFDMPLLELIMNIAGKDIRKKLAPSLPKNESDEIDWLLYTCKTNSNILKFLRDFSVFLPHVKSKYLLNYDDYLRYEQIKHPQNVPMEGSVFCRLSKQCWIDLILQIIKVFFLFRIVPISDYYELGNSESSNKLKSYHSISLYSHSSILDFDSENLLLSFIYGDRENQLLTWLQECYDQARTSLWSLPAPEKEILFFDDDLSDGLVLGAVTATYCPYVRSEIQEMYPTPYNPEEFHHNICVLVTTWQMLKLSYIISPFSLQKPCMLEMFLLVNYLYEVLPYYSPREKIKIEAPLTQINSALITLENLGTEMICYRLEFFGNEANLFSVAQTRVVVLPKVNRVVDVKYHAKFVETTNVTLVFSGETPGYKYGKSIVVELEGIADVSYVCMTIPFTLQLYQHCDVSVTLQSPFKVRALYSMSYGYEHASKEQKVLYPLEEFKELKNIKQFAIQNETFESDEQGRLVITSTCCCTRNGPRNIWAYFTNPEVGDWGIHLIVTGKPNPNCYEKINVEIPKNYDSLVCRCRKKPCVTTNCPMIIYVKIPKINTPLWNARKSTILRCVRAEESSFWSQHLFSSLGTRILKLILNSETHPSRDFIPDSTKYKTVLKKPSPFITLKDIIIDDVISSDYYDLPIHPLKKLNEIHNAELHLVSEDKQETRYYHLIFGEPSVKIKT